MTPRKSEILKSCPEALGDAVLAPSAPEVAQVRRLSDVSPLTMAPISRPSNLPEVGTSWWGRGGRIQLTLLAVEVFIVDEQGNSKEDRKYS